MVLLALLLAVPSFAHATIYFDDSFETCAAGTGSDYPCEGWDDFGQENVAYHRVSTVRAFSGTKSVHLTYDNGAFNPSIYKSFTAGNHIFLRSAVYQVAGFIPGANGASKRFRFRSSNSTANDPNPTDGLGAYPIFWVYNYFGSWAVNIEQPCDNLPGGYWITAGTPAPDKWEQFELEIIMNTGGLPNGGLRIWVDNVLRVQVLNRAWVSATPTGTSCAGSPNNPYWHPSDWVTSNIQLYKQSGTGNVFFDRIAVGNERIGIVGQQPAQDTTNPNPPTNLTAQ